MSLCPLFKHYFAFILIAQISLLGPCLAMDGVEEGRLIYADKCAECHGEELRNTGSAFDLRELEPKDRQRFQTSVLEGKGQMPSWLGVVSTGDIDHLWAYIMSMTHN
jgi:cytochrome c6